MPTELEIRKILQLSYLKLIIDKRFTRSTISTTLDLHDSHIYILCSHSPVLWKMISTLHTDQRKVRYTRSEMRLNPNNINEIIIACEYCETIIYNRHFAAISILN